LPARRKYAAFKAAGRQNVRVLAVEGESAAPTKATKRAVTVDLATVKPGDEFEGVVTSVAEYGAFVSFGAEKEGLVHVSQLSDKFIKNASDVVKVSDTVKVRVLSVDAASGRIALSMKSGAAAGGAADAGEAYADAGEGVAEDDSVFEAAEGYEYVFPAAGADYDFPFEMEEEDAELTVEAVTAFENADDAEFTFEHSTDVEVPINELVTGKVSRIEEYGVFVTFNHNGKEYTGLLEREEAKVPSSALSAEELAEWKDGDLVPQYVDIEVETVSKYYKPGDEVSAFILEYNEQGKIALTQFADFEIEAAALEDDADENEELSTSGLSTFDNAGVDVLAMDPLDLLKDSEEEEGQIAAAFSDLEATGPMGQTDAVADYSAFGPGSSQYTSGLFRGEFVSPYVFPSRPLKKVDSYSLASLGIKDRDFDGDEIELEDFWQSTIKVPKDALRALGYKLQFDDKGEAEVVEREGAEVNSDDMLWSGDQKARVAAFVKDLMEDDEDEAELPALAIRRPVVLAMAVQNISAATVKSLRDKTGAGMMDCKKALAENDGDVDKSIEVQSARRSEL